MKHTCRMIIPDIIAEDPKFRAAKVLIGRGGENTRSIADETGAKLRVRGKGSGHLEGPDNIESDDPLMLCISCSDRESYEEAKAMVTDIFELMFDSFREH